MPENYPRKPADFGRIRSYGIESRKSLVDTSMFTNMDKYNSTRRYSDLLPPVLKAGDLLAVAEAIREAKKEGRRVIAALGAHVIKCGLSPIIIDLMERGTIDAVALNGAGAVHDMEIAFHGATSEDVAEEIGSGRFGMVEQTPAHFNAALKNMKEGDGMGVALGRYMTGKNMVNNHLSILASGYRLKIPVTVHVAIGTDIVHTNPEADGAAIGQATMTDFKVFTSVVSGLSGGVYMNVGSAVVLPEVFLKALSTARNIGEDAREFTAVNFDMIQGYRPNVNVVNRPTLEAGKGYSITGHHEIMIPLLYHLLVGEG